MQGSEPRSRIKRFDFPAGVPRTTPHILDRRQCMPCLVTADMPYIEANLVQVCAWYGYHVVWKDSYTLRVFYNQAADCICASFRLALALRSVNLMRMFLCSDRDGSRDSLPATLVQRSLPIKRAMRGSNSIEGALRK